MSLDFNIGSAAVPASLQIDPTTDGDVFAALTANTPFPDRDVQIGRIVAGLSIPSVSFNPGAGGSVSIQAAASFTSGLAIDHDPHDVESALPLDPSVTLDFQNGPDDRLIMLSLGYTATGSVNGTYPIGLVGSASFGVSGQSDAAFAVVHRFNKNAPSHDVLAAVTDNLKLPIQVRTAADLGVATWLIAEVDGSIAINLAANLGYNLTYKIPPLKLLGVSHDLGVKIDAAVTATLGFNASGKFLIVLSRPSAAAGDQTFRLQLMKQRKQGYDIGLALTAGITASPGLPDAVDDFLASVLGVQGQQILKDLHSIEGWVSGDLGSNLAALTTTTAKDLLRKVTGVDPDTALAEASGVLTDALSKWDQLAQNGSTEVQSLVWNLLGNPDAAVRGAVINLLTGLSAPATFSQTLSDGLQSLESRQWLLALSDAVGAVTGLALGQHQTDVQNVATSILSVLNGGIFTKLQQYIDSQLDLNAIRTAADPTKLTQWLQDRLAAFLDEKLLQKTDLPQIQKALQALGSKISDLYNKTKSAINSRYSLDFATKYALNTADTALIDVQFDMSQAGAAQSFQKMIGGSVDPLFDAKAPIAGVTINEALLTHEIHSSATTHFAIPYFTADTAHLNDTVATLSIEQNGAHLVASVDSKDQVNTDRYASILELADNLTADGAIVANPSGTVAYEMRLIRPAMTQIELENGTVDFVDTYLADKFPSADTYTDKFLKDLDIAISHAMPNPTNNFGDMAISMQVTLTADLLQGWLVKRDAPALLAAQVAASRLIQTFLRKYTSLLYFQNLNNLIGNAAAPLLVWSALPVAAGVDWDQPDQILNAVDTGKAPYWDIRDSGLLTAMVNSNIAESALESIVSAASGPYRRFLALGDKHNASFYGPPFDGVGGNLRRTVLTMGPGGQAMAQFTGLLVAENSVIGNVSDALEAASSAVAKAGSAADTRATIQVALAEFARSVTLALNSGMSNIYTGQNLMLYGPMLLVELSHMLAPQSASPKRSAMLQLLSLKPGYTADLAQFLAGSFPDLDHVAIGQSVVSSAT